MKLPNRPINIGILGVSGLVGHELLSLLDSRRFPVGSLRLLGSQTRKQVIAGASRDIELTTESSFDGLDLVFSAVDSDLAKQFAPIAVKAGAIFVDKSSAYRLHPGVPLIIPEINGHLLAKHNGIIASPNCATTIMLMGLYPLIHRFGAVRICVSTYQSVTGGGRGSLDSWQESLREYVGELEDGEELQSINTTGIFNTVQPHIGDYRKDGYTDEEQKIADETRKILEVPSLSISATAVRVPIERGHAVSVEVEMMLPISTDVALAMVQDADGLKLADPDARDYIGDYPHPRDTVRKDYCTVGRIRRSSAFENGFSLFISGDNLWKGAALNAVQIAEYLIDGR